MLLKPVGQKIRNSKLICHRYFYTMMLGFTKRRNVKKINLIYKKSVNLLTYIIGYSNYFMNSFKQLKLIIFVSY